MGALFYQSKFVLLQLPAIEFCYTFFYCIRKFLVKVLFARRYFQYARQSLTHTSEHIHHLP